MACYVWLCRPRHPGHTVLPPPPPPPLPLPPPLLLPPPQLMSSISSTVRTKSFSLLPICINRITYFKSFSHGIILSAFSRSIYVQLARPAAHNRRTRVQK